MLKGISVNYHASIRFDKENIIIYFDPYKIKDYKNDANYIFITHSHYDHYSKDDIKKVMNSNTKFIITSDLKEKVINLGILEKNIFVVYPNKNYVLDNINFDTIPAYNLDKQFHKKISNWVGYNILLDGNRYYIVGDSDVTEELQKVKCDVMFTPVGGIYTMNDEEAAIIVNKMKPKYAIPIHYDEVGSKQNAENFIMRLNENIKGVILK